MMSPIGTGWAALALPDVVVPTFSPTAARAAAAAAGVRPITFGTRRSANFGVGIVTSWNRICSMFRRMSVPSFVGDLKPPPALAAV